MRDIKFRAWYEPTGLYGCYTDGEMITWLELLNMDEDLLAVLTEQGYTPMQYTGLKDRSGQDIYEGDILQYDMERYEVYWSTDWAMFAVKGPQVQALMRYAEYGVVVGNIYDHPHLLRESAIESTAILSAAEADEDGQIDLLDII